MKETHVRESYPGVNLAKYLQHSLPGGGCFWLDLCVPNLDSETVISIAGTTCVVCQESPPKKQRHFDIFINFDEELPHGQPEA